MTEFAPLTEREVVPSADAIDLKIEAVVLPVADVERSKRFYGGLGWRLDADFVVGDGRLIQFTPRGSACSVHFGDGVTSAEPGSVRGLYLVVSDIEAARVALIARGADVSEIFHRDGPGKPAISGVHPARASYFSYATFSDPDGNEWLLQEVTTRFPGRVDSNVTSFGSTSDLASAMRRASVAHGEHERRTDGKRHENWPDWYAEYMAAEQAGRELPV
jgi:catechol 2,3-dioxygenase-like lactoylglutathione lyase family enzyme